MNKEGNVRAIGTKLMLNHDINDPQTVLERTHNAFERQSVLSAEELQAIYDALDGTGIPHAANRLHAHWSRAMIRKLQDDL